MLVHPLLKGSSSTAAPKVYCSCTGCSEWIYEGHHLLANILWSATSQARRKLLDSLPRMLLSPLSDGAVRVCGWCSMRLALRCTFGCYSDFDDG
uniref:Predicted protein n=1 Tax=Hordeum vulgare subsp. vulgare TaxID=112509 RepID=F2DEH6_HORVV|nr:predicted protein [Hordeum vulgare subsp. vulgare]